MSRNVERRAFPRSSDKPLSGERDNDDKLRPVDEVVERGVGLSGVRIKALLYAGKVEGEMRREGRGPGKWYTSVAAVKRYREDLPTREEFGRRGGLIAGRGRPKSTSSEETS